MILWQKNPLLLSILMYWENLEVFLNPKIRLLLILKLIWGQKILFITVLWSSLKRWILRQKNWPFCFIQVTYSKIGKQVIQFFAIQYFKLLLYSLLSLLSNLKLKLKKKIEKKIRQMAEVIAKHFGRVYKNPWSKLQETEIDSNVNSKNSVKLL